MRPLYLQKKLNRYTTDRKYDFNDGNSLLKFNGKYNGRNLSVSVVKKSSTTKEFSVSYNKKTEVFSNEKNTLKYLTTVFTQKNEDGVGEIKVVGNLEKSRENYAIDTIVKKMEDEMGISDEELDNIDEIKDDEEFSDGDLEISKEFNPDDEIPSDKDKKKNTKTKNAKGYNPNNAKEVLEYMEKHKIGNYKLEQVGYLDEEMPSKEILENLVVGVKRGSLSNYYSGVINNLLREHNLFDRYRIIRIHGYYYGFDKEENSAMSIADFLKMLKTYVKDFKSSTFEQIYISSVMQKKE